MSMPRRWRGVLYFVIGIGADAVLIWSGTTKTLVGVGVGVGFLLLAGQGLRYMWEYGYGVSDE